MRRGKGVNPRFLRWRRETRGQVREPCCAAFILLLLLLPLLLTVICLSQDMLVENSVGVLILILGVCFVTQLFSHEGN